MPPLECACPLAPIVSALRGRRNLEAKPRLSRASVDEEIRLVPFREGRWSDDGTAAVPPQANGPEERSFDGMRKGLVGHAYAVAGLRLGEALIQQLLHQPRAREALRVEVLLRFQSGPLVPVHSGVVHRVGGVRERVALVLQLLDQALASGTLP